jgi:hypothetical protein
MRVRYHRGGRLKPRCAAQIAGVPTTEDVRQVIEELGDVASALTGAAPALKAKGVRGRRHQTRVPIERENPARRGCTARVPTSVSEGGLVDLRYAVASPTR